MSAAEASFYRRPLPSHLVALSSAEGRALFKEAMLEGGMEGYFPLAEQLHTQADPAFCGLGSLVVTLNALAIDPGRLWKGPWRWFEEEMLDCCAPLDDVRKEGITLGQFACLARCNGARAKVFPADGTTITEMRHYVRAASSAPSGKHVVAAYSRAALGQTGTGHYSPVGGYHRGRDMALLLDVARFKYPPHWVPIPMLWEAMQSVDAVTGRPRGFVVLTRGEARGAPLCRVPCEGAGEGAGAGAWRGALRALKEAFSGALSDGRAATVEEAARALGRRLSPEATRLVEESSDPAVDPDPEGRRRAREALVEEIRSLDLFAAARCALEVSGSKEDLAAERLVILLLACPADLRAAMPEPLAARVAELRSPGALPPLVEAEVSRIRSQLEAIEEACCGPA
jgi:glutathione gamma-glutamylcysteinyltransferase